MKKNPKLFQFDEEVETIIDSIFERHRDNQGLRDFVLLKAAEELNELSAELIQKVLHPTHEKDQPIVDEIGDVLIRLSVLVKFYDLELINERIKYKANIMKNNFNGKY